MNISRAFCKYLSPKITQPGTASGSYTQSSVSPYRRASPVYFNDATSG